jgi:hypothetical protein
MTGMNARSLLLRSDALRNVFPRGTPEEDRLFKLLKRAYVDARYDPGFAITSEELAAIALRSRVDVQRSRAQPCAYVRGSRRISTTPPRASTQRFSASRIVMRRRSKKVSSSPHFRARWASSSTR